MENVTEFLNELTLLSRKYNIKIAGCGCCGSPYLAEITDGAEDRSYKVTEYLDELSFTHPMEN